MLSPEWKDHPEAPGQAPGVQGLIEVVASFHEAFKGLHITEEQVVAEDDHVVVRIRIEGRHVGAFLGHAPTGETVTFSGMDMHRIKDGSITETWHFEDFSSLDK
ncbi:ester cyclase [Rhizobium phaseoli]|uniref:ester cyclase n=1 Tax=Rhizobium phaseoli TaxID=396 RepID=UPI001AEC8B9D|nr:ester cyclase [Rhizobium phaseoli]